MKISIRETQYFESLLEEDVVHLPRVGEGIHLDSRTYLVETVCHNFDDDMIIVYVTRKP